MSGHKRATISISQEEYQRLQDAEVQLKALPEPKIEVIEQIHQESQDGIRASMDWMTYRQEQFSNLLDGFNDHLREVESSTSQLLLNHHYEMQQEMDRQNGVMWESAVRYMDDLSRYYESQVLVEHQRNQEQLSRFERRLGRMAGDAQRKNELAEQWLVSAEQLCAFIKQNYNYTFFVPGQVERLEQQLVLAHESFEQGMPEAVLVTAQQVYTHFSEMRIQLERLEAEWQVLYCSAWEGTCHVQAVASENQVVDAVDLDGQSLGVELDVDYWSNGGISRVFFDVESIFNRLEDTEERPDIGELKGILTEQVPELQQSLESAVFDARVAAINSQLRINIADLVVQALQEQGFSLEEANYQGVDMRQAFSAHLVNFDGSEVEVQVNPYGQGLGENELHLKSFDEKLRTEHELLQRWREINQSLARRGLAVRQMERLQPAMAVRESRRNRYLPGTTRAVQGE
jgi:hypothetical protein